MGTRLYPLPGGDGDGKKVWYPLGLGMRMNFLCGDEYGIVKPVPAPLPSLVRSIWILFPHQGLFYWNSSLIIFIVWKNIKTIIKIIEI